VNKLYTSKVILQLIKRGHPKSHCKSGRITMALSSGFNVAEALDLVALSAIVEGGEAPPQPTGWNMIFDSPVIGQFTEKWQLWQNASGSYAIVLRGTVLDAGSILEDLLSFLVPASGRLTVGHIEIDYSFAASPDASVHFGFALGTLLLLKDPNDGILVQLASKVPTGTVKEPRWPHCCGLTLPTPPMRPMKRIIPTRPMSTRSLSQATIIMPAILRAGFAILASPFE
jgi:hypothetical protein